MLTLMMTCLCDSDTGSAINPEWLEWHAQLTDKLTVHIHTTLLCRRYDRSTVPAVYEWHARAAIKLTFQHTSTTKAHPPYSYSSIPFPYVGVGQ